MGSDDDSLLAEQIAYYRAGAAEYDRPLVVNFNADAAFAELSADGEVTAVA